MQFNVPQFIDIEDKIIGPLTLKQFFLVLGGGVGLMFLWYFFKLWVVMIVGLPLLLFLAATIFIKINGRSFFTFLTAWINYWLKPRIFVWRRK
jgi:hypothetical protein